MSCLLFPAHPSLILFPTPRHITLSVSSVALLFSFNLETIFFSVPKFLMKVTHFPVLGILSFLVQSRCEGLWPVLLQLVLPCSVDIPQEACSFLKGYGGRVDLGEKGGVEWREGKLW